MNERELVLDVLAILKSHVTDPFLMGQIARAEDDIDLERPVPDGICHCDPQPESSALGECPRCRRLDVRKAFA